MGLAASKASLFAPNELTAPAPKTGSSQRSLFLVLAKSSAASGDVNGPYTRDLSYMPPIASRRLTVKTRV